MQVIRDTFANPQIYNMFWDLYQASFPDYEQRSHKSQKSLQKADKFTLLSFCEGKQYIGFLAYWNLNQFCYLEHFAISPNLRGKGYGSEIINHFSKIDGKKLLLEIDPVADNISRKRCEFYEKLGFKSNDFDFINPGYKGKEKPHRLTLMSKPTKLSHNEYANFCRSLRNDVLVY